MMNSREYFKRFRSAIGSEELRKRQATKQEVMKAEEREKLKGKLRPRIKKVCKQFARATKGKLVTQYDARSEAGPTHDFFCILYGGDFGDSKYVGNISLECYYMSKSDVTEINIEASISGETAKCYLPVADFAEDKLLAKLEECCRKVLEHKGYEF